MIHQIDEKTISPADYTIQIENLPVYGSDTLSSDKGIKYWVENNSTRELPIKVYKIIRTHFLDEFIEI
jgi:phenylalanine-4-hydroxylase